MRSQNGNIKKFPPPVSGENREGYNDLVLIQYIFFTQQNVGEGKSMGLFMKKDSDGLPQTIFDLNREMQYKKGRLTPGFRREKKY